MTDRRDAAALAGLWLPYLVLARHFWWVCDDAFISFRYARNWAAGHGLRYNLGEHAPVEGFSNFLWVVVAAVFERLGWDPTFWVPAVSLASGMVLLALVYRYLRTRLGVARPASFLATLTLSCFPPFAVWATSGLETMPFALAVFLVFDLLVAREEPRSLAAAIAALAMSLLRIEGIAWALVLGLLSIATRPHSRRAVASHVKYLTLVGLGFAVFFAIRFDYYGLPFPNPVYTKVRFSPAVALRGFRYVATFFLTFLTPFVVVPAAFVAFRSRGVRILPVVLMAVAFPAYGIVVGGDWMTMGRFLVPGLPFVTVLVGLSLERMWERRALTFGVVAATLVIGLLPGWDVHLVPDSIRDEFRFRYFNSRRTEAFLWEAQKTRPLNARDIGLALKRISKPGDSLVYGAIGSIGYYSDLFIYDRYGLVTREVALRPRDAGAPLRAPGHDGEVSRGFFLKDRPTYIALTAFGGGDIRQRVLAQAEDWRELLSPRLWRVYVPDFVEVNDEPDDEAEGVVMVLRLIEEAPDDPIRRLPRPERRRARAERAETLWDAVFERARLLPGEESSGS